MVSLLFSPTHISMSPWSQPGITWPIPNGKLNGIPRSWLKKCVKKNLWSTSVSVFVSVFGWWRKTLCDHPNPFNGDERPFMTIQTHLMVTKDLSWPSKPIGWRQKTFHDHPSQSLDSHWGFFAIIQPYCLHHIWMVAKCLSRPVCMLCSGGSRIFLGGANCQSGFANLYFWPKIAWKWKNLDRGASVPWRPP